MSIFHFWEIIEKIRKAISFGKSLGIRYFFYLFYICLVLPCFMRILPTYAFFYRRYKNLTLRFKLNKYLRRWESKKEEILKICEKGYKLRIDDLGLNKKGLDRIKKSLCNKTELVIGDIDQDGLIYSYYGPLNGVATTPKEDFLKKSRFELKLVVFNNIVAVKKMFKGYKLNFLNALDAFYNLNLAGVRVPAILDIDFGSPSMTLSFIAGLNLEELLFRKGAKIRDRDMKKNKNLVSLSQEQGWRYYIQEGRKVLLDAVDQQFIEDLFIKIKKNHRVGIELYDIKYDKVIIEKKTQKPFFIDFESTRNFASSGKKTFSVMRDRDIEKFNLCFKTKKLTYKMIKKIIQDKKVPFLDRLYSPVYFGYGLRIGKIWDINVGFGRWNFILKKHLLPLTGKRILSLGANNGFNAIQMLKNGAKEVIGVEANKDYIEQGNFIKEVFEWADNEFYNLKYLPLDMAKLPEYNLGTFDLVVALCSLYYLDNLSIFKLVRHLSTITDKLVLQCNIRQGIGRENVNDYRKASIEYNIKALKENGFPRIKVIAPPGYSRPLIIGQKK